MEQWLPVTALKLDVTEVQLSPQNHNFIGSMTQTYCCFLPVLDKMQASGQVFIPFTKLWSDPDASWLCLWIPCSQQLRAALSCGSYQEPRHISMADIHLLFKAQCWWVHLLLSQFVGISILGLTFQKSPKHWQVESYSLYICLRVPVGT